MILINKLKIAVIGDEDLVSVMRLAGVNRYHVIKDDHDIGEDVRRVLTELVAEPEIGVIAIQEDYTQYAQDFITRVQEGPRLTPVIIEVPSKYGTKYGDVTEYYRAYIRKFVGFDIEI